jgi:hypothetical protein
MQLRQVGHLTLNQRVAGSRQVEQPILSIDDRPYSDALFVERVFRLGNKFVCPLIHTFIEARTKEAIKPVRNWVIRGSMYKNFILEF